MHGLTRLFVNFPLFTLAIFCLGAECMSWWSFLRRFLVVVLYLYILILIRDGVHELRRIFLDFKEVSLAYFFKKSIFIHAFEGMQNV